MKTEAALQAQRIEERYARDLAEQLLLQDAAQEKAVNALQALADRLMEREHANKQKGLFSVLKQRVFKSARPYQAIKGLYFWGGVGRGKTYLMDLFFESLPLDSKLRLHFHRFMQYVHSELTRLQGRVDPLVSVAEKLAGQYSVICLDEFFVKDITDAMLLAGLLDALFERGVVLVTTSNIQPSDLYKDGLQRTRFLPAIDLLEKHTDILNVDGGVDYRLRTLKKAELFHCPLDDSAYSSLQKSFDELAPEPGKPGEVIEILGRKLQSLMCADDIIWFDFQELCGGPRSQNDYIELARIYHAVLISNVPVMGVKTDDWARRFINLIDEFYDRNVKVIMSAEAPIDKLYKGGHLSFEFERTQSRLLEMQSHEYLAREHKP